MIRLTDEEIQKQVGGYAKDSQSLWRSGSRRITKLDEAMSLPSVCERVAEAQLKKVVEWLKERDRNNHMGFAEYGESDLLIDEIDWQALLEETK